MDDSASLAISTPQEGIAQLTFDMPGKGENILTQSVLEELSACLDRLEGPEFEGLEGLVIASNKLNIFIAGADIREFADSLDISSEQTKQMCQRGQRLFARLSSCPFVTVAAIDGVCVGGGAELAVWCDRRVLSSNPKTQFGFPEVKLGLFPGWGGTARTPRMIGLSNALELITGGESLDTMAAYKLGLANDVATSEGLIDAACRMIRGEQQTGQYLRDRETWSQPIPISETELGFLGVTASGYIRQQTKGQYPAPEAALETMLEAASADVSTACEIEAEGMSHLFGTPINAALINVFFLTDRNKKDRGVDGECVPREIGQVGVIGAGIMGSGIAAANIKRGLPVTFSDAVEDSLRSGVRTALEEASYDRKTKGPSSQKSIELAPLLNICKVEQEYGGADLVIEAVVENAEVKQKVLARLEPLLGESAILASNTSTIPITQLAAKLRRPEQFCGIHFFNPVRRMKLVEVIRGQQTNDETIATAVAYAKKLGKMPIVVNDGPGFLVNRLLLPYMGESLELLCEGASMKDVERAAKSFGMPMGPLTLYDMVGIDTAYYAGRTMWEAFPERIVASPVLSQLVRRERYGQKTGAGFYNYQNKRRRGEPDPEFDELLEPYIRERREFSREELTDRLFMPMLLEATRVLEENLVRDVRDVDLGLIFGLGFPPFKGGLLHWADTIGAARIVERLKPIESLGERMKPTSLLLEMAKSNQTFYAL